MGLDGQSGLMVIWTEDTVLTCPHSSSSLSFIFHLSFTLSPCVRELRGEILACEGQDKDSKVVSNQRIKTIKDTLEKI